MSPAGEVLWAGHGTLPGTDGWVSLHLADSAHLTLPDHEELESTPLHDAVLQALGGGGAYFFRQLSDASGWPRESCSSPRSERRAARGVGGATRGAGLAVTVRPGRHPQRRSRSRPTPSPSPSLVGS